MLNQKIQIPQNAVKVQKVVKSKTHEIRNNIVFITENGKSRMETILNVGPNGVYTSDDNFYGWEKF